MFLLEECEVAISLLKSLQLVFSLHVIRGFLRRVFLLTVVTTGRRSCLVACAGPRPILVAHKGHTV